MCVETISLLTIYVFFSFFSSSLLLLLQAADWQKRTLFSTLSRTTRGARREQKKTGESTINSKKRMKRSESAARENEREKKKCNTKTQNKKTKRKRRSKEWCVFMCRSTCFFSMTRHIKKRNRHSLKGKKKKKKHEEMKKHFEYEWSFFSSLSSFTLTSSGRFVLLWVNLTNNNKIESKTIKLFDYVCLLFLSLSFCKIWCWCLSSSRRTQKKNPTCCFFCYVLFDYLQRSSL